MMAYLHCHSCDWSQDDFWYWRWSGFKRFWKWKYRPFGYNPVSLILEDIAQYWKPEYIEYDQWFAEECGWKSNVRHSWAMMIWSIKGHIKRIFRMKWWTEQSWKRDREIAVCPNCGARNFDID